MLIHIVWCWRYWDTWIQEIKAMLKVLKIFYRFQCTKCYVGLRCQRWCLWLLCNTAYRELLLILLMLKVLKMSNTIYSVYRASCLSKGEATCYLKSLMSCGFSSSSLVSPRRQFCKLSWTCQLQGWLQTRTHSQSPILKLTQGVISNPVILTYLWEQSCILHTLTKLPA